MQIHSQIGKSRLRNDACRCLRPVQLPGNHRHRRKPPPKQLQPPSPKPSPDTHQQSYNIISISPKFFAPQPPPPLHQIQIQAKREHFFAKRVEISFQFCIFDVVKPTCRTIGNFGNKL